MIFELLVQLNKLPLRHHHLVVRKCEIKAFGDRKSFRYMFIQRVEIHDLLPNEEESGFVELLCYCMSGLYNTLLSQL